MNKVKLWEIRCVSYKESTYVVANSAEDAITKFKTDPGTPRNSEIEMIQQTSMRMIGLKE